MTTTPTTLPQEPATIAAPTAAGALPKLGAITASLPK